ncbi:fatty-acyl-CoA synthase [Reichenbachiella faecimaris]|uniref:Fatty-acyl-CoA synthase n=1 Tax=Reichenbachiella faecimaris TaxID=692418 RepID=A0A1W2GMQ4_REIFA|nr:AMP-binding protein [Reichenbachiella faecimaris]SMD37939.1 fatty-acyl-CoA synthase [Reichenbachiella faecimaris]
MYKKDWISKWAIYSPDKVAISEYETNRTITYQQLNLRANYLSNKLVSDGFKTGDRLMVIAEHCIEYVALFAMAQKTGITLVPVNYRLSSSEIEYLISNSKPTCIIAERKFEHLIAEQAKVEVIWMEDLTQELAIANETQFSALDFDENHPLFILYTSGTTGFPKGAIYSHKMLFWNSVNTSQSLEIVPSDHTISCMPAFHTGGWNVLLTPLLHRGASVGIMKKFEADQLLQWLEKEKSQLFMGVPTMLKMMAESEQFKAADLSQMRYFIVGGEALPLSVINTWHNKGVKIRQGYGLTEVGPNLTSLHQDHAERKIGSIGLPNFYTEIKLMTPNGEEVKANEIGELCLAGPLVTPGYWNNEKATKEAIQDGWFHTGDLAKMDEEGFLYIVDRIKCMFISGGENVYPAEVERVLRQMPEIDEAAVVGVEDTQWGEVGKAYLTATNERLPSTDLIASHCAKYLAKFKVPKYIVWLKEMPKNDSGKIDRKKLKA